MKYFPMFLRVADQDVFIIGGGEQAAQKARLMLKTEARITLVAPELDEELSALISEGAAKWRGDRATADIVRGAALVFICTGDSAQDAEICSELRPSGAMINVVDQPELCDATTPSIVDRDPLVIAIGTEGAAPVLARQIKTRIEETLEPRLGELVALAARLRLSAAQHVASERRRGLWRWVFGGAPRRLHARGAEREAASLLKEAIAAGGAPDDAGHGALTLIGAGPGPVDLLTLRAVQRLQEADIVFYPDTSSAAVLELARRDCTRICIGKTPVTAAWTEAAIAERVMAELALGRRVLRILPGAGKQQVAELDLAVAAKFDVERVPGLKQG